MRACAGEPRRAIHAVYAFCRRVDDIADGAAPPSEKRRFLDAWRREIEAPVGGARRRPIGRELARAAKRLFALPLASATRCSTAWRPMQRRAVRLADDAALDLYGRRVAGAVGRLSVRIFGAPGPIDFALGLGRTLQLVNILRDVDEDAAAETGLRAARAPRPSSASRTARRGASSADRASLACAGPRRARPAGGFRGGGRGAPQPRPPRLKPAILMMEGYRRLLDRLQAAGLGQTGRAKAAPHRRATGCNSSA